MTPRIAKKTYTTFAVERPIDATRTRTWATLLAVDTPETPESGTVLSLEPPWRRVVRIAGSPLRFYEETTTIRDDGESCHLTISAVIDPQPGGASDRLVEQLRTQAEHRINTLVAAATKEPADS